MSFLFFLSEVDFGAEIGSFANHMRLWLPIVLVLEVSFADFFFQFRLLIHGYLGIFRLHFDSFDIQTSIYEASINGFAAEINANWNKSVFVAFLTSHATANRKYLLKTSTKKSKPEIKL